MGEKDYVYPQVREFQNDYGIMYPESAQKMALYPHRDERFSMATKNVTIVVTEDCTLRCSYCYQHNKNACHIMSKDTARKIVDMLFEEDRKENPYLNDYIAQAIIIDFIGGEPTLEAELMEYFMRYFLWKAVRLNHRWALQYMISISSNGTLYFTPAMQRFMTLFNGRVSLTLTLDGSRELHDACRRYPDGRPSYDIVARATRHCQHVFGQATDTKLTIAPANVMYLAEAVKNLHNNFDFQGVHANCVYEEGWETWHGKILYEQMKQLADWMIANDVQRHFYCSLYDDSIGRPMPPTESQNWCGGTGSMLCFTTKGDITPCLRYTHFNLNDRQPEIRIGSLTDGLAEKPEHRAIMRKLDSITRQSQSEQKCLDCPIARGCSWCSAYNYEVYGTPNKRTTFICPMHIARVLGNVYYWNTLYRKHEDPDRFPMHTPREWTAGIIDDAEFDTLTALACEDASG